jgi:hypothetical protein
MYLYQKYIKQENYLNVAMWYFFVCKSFEFFKLKMGNC